VSTARPAIAALGAGRMGRGLAHVFAYAGHAVALVDSKQRTGGDTERVLAEAANDVAASIGMIARFGLIDADQEAEILGRITYHDAASGAAAIAGAAFVFEGVPEVMAHKEEAFRFLSQCADARAVIASTTSTFLVDSLAAFVDHKARFLNAHWLNPAFLIPLVEVSPGADTAPQTVTALTTLLERVGKVPVVCKASPGFIVPRIQSLAMSEAARLVEEGVASPADIDKATRVGFGLRFAVLGLLEFIDWGGGDILYYANNYLRTALDSDRFETPEICVRNMAEGRIGPKTGQGFYDYRDMDVAAYQRETLRKFVDLLHHLGLMPPPGGVDAPQTQRPTPPAAS
jgi:3-hydroxybutyryl-CoA dehydrogenase